MLTNIGIFLIVCGFILAVVRAFRIGDPAGSGPIRMSVPREGFGLFFEGQTGFIVAALVIVAGILVMIL